MADDKRIRVTADATPLQELRQGAQALWDDLNRMESQFKGLATQTLEVLRGQIDLLKERNSLSNGFNINGGIITSPRQERGLIDPNSGRPISLIGGSPLRQLDPQSSTRQLTTLDKIYAAVSAIAETLEAQFRNQQNGVLPDNGGDGGGGGVPLVPGNGGGGRNNRRPKNDGSFGSFKFPTSIQGLMRALPFGAALMAIGTFFGRQAQFETSQYAAENSLQRQNNIGKHWLLNAITFGMTGAQAERAEIARQAASENNNVLREYATLHNTSYREAVRDQYNMAFKGFRVEDSSRARIRSGSNQVIPGTNDVSLFSKDMYDLVTNENNDSGSSNFKERLEYYVNRNKPSDKYEARNWASDVLGLNMADYLSKVTTLQRAGVAGGNTSLGDINQLLMAERIRGLSNESVSNVLQTTRFANQGGLTGAGVVKAFDTNLQGVYAGRSDAEQRIAATLDEHLGTFVNIAEEVLNRTGSVNTENIVRTMTGIHNATGMEGRQLERVQKSLSGIGISEDPTSQAFLMRVARQLYPDAGGFTDLMEKIEAMPHDPKLQAEFYDEIRRMSGGGGERFRTALKAFMPNLQWADVNALDRGDITFKDILEKGRTKGTDYKEGDSSSKVSPQERSNAGTKNLHILEGTNQELGGDEKNPTSIQQLLERLDKPISVFVVNESGVGSVLTPEAMKELIPEITQPIDRLRKDLQQMTLKVPR